jgi:hypothetical protein
LIGRKQPPGRIQYGLVGGLSIFVLVLTLIYGGPGLLLVIPVLLVLMGATEMTWRWMLADRYQAPWRRLRSSGP